MVEQAQPALAVRARGRIVAALDLLDEGEHRRRVAAAGPGASRSAGAAPGAPSAPGPSPPKRHRSRIRKCCASRVMVVWWCQPRQPRTS